MSLLLFDILYLVIESTILFIERHLRFSIKFIMIKNSSSLAVVALLLNSSVTEEVTATSVEQKASSPFEDVEAIQVEN